MANFIVGNLDGGAVRNPDGSYRTNSQQGWQWYFDIAEKRLPTVREYVAVLKQLHDQQSPALQGILQDLRESRLCTEITINYDKSNIPLGMGYINNLIKDSAWRKALEDEIFQYDVKEANRVLQEISGKRPYIWTPSAEGRKSNPKRAVWLNIYADRFSLNCDDLPIGILGRARGVREISATDMNIEQKIQDALEVKLLRSAIIKDYNNNPARPLYNPNDLEYVKRRMAGIPSGTVMDWKKR